MSTITEADALAIAEALADYITLQSLQRDATMHLAGMIATKLSLNPNWFHDKIIEALK